MIYILGPGTELLTPSHFLSHGRNIFCSDEEPPPQALAKLVAKETSHGSVNWILALPHPGKGWDWRWS